MERCRDERRWDKGVATGSERGREGKSKGGKTGKRKEEGQTGGEREVGVIQALKPLLKNTQLKRA